MSMTPAPILCIIATANPAITKLMRQKCEI